MLNDILEVLDFSEADIKRGRKVKESELPKKTNFKGRDVKYYVPNRLSVYNTAIFSAELNFNVPTPESESEILLRKNGIVALK